VSGSLERTRAEAAVVIERTIELCSIPAPTGGEAARAELVASWWNADGWEDVRVDETGNVWAGVPGGDDGAVLVCAHLDTVFPADVAHGARADGDRLRGPGVGDDAVGVASLSAVARGLDPDAAPRLWLVATVGEEGLGNLRGIRAALADLDGSVGAVLAIEGNYLGRVSSVGVGSLRWRVEARGPGGHAWEAAEAPSAVHTIAAIAASLGALSHEGTRTSANVGTIGGGEAINARGRAAWLELDLRADEPSALDAMENLARERIQDATPEGIEVEVHELGRRPAGRLDPGDPLVEAAAASLASLGIDPEFVATSTDANAAHAAGIPAVAIGITTGGGEHTPQEWISLEPIPLGLASVAGTIARWGEAR
jgi:acetylornithine deacetylase/succinyl-diaminopimelate desuccinylase-like protein